MLRSLCALTTTEDTLSAAQTNVSDFQDLVSPVQDVVVTEAGPIIQRIVDGIPGLLKVLDDVASIHPFIKCKHVLSLRSPCIPVLPPVYSGCGSFPCCSRVGSQTKG